MTDSEFGSVDDADRGPSDAASPRTTGPAEDGVSDDSDFADAGGDALLDALRPIVRAADEGGLPKRIRRYRIERLLGSGSFGKVYLARDHQLQRDVAIKVPATELLSRPGQASNYLEEARTIANLEHPHIVPVYDVGSTYDFPCFIVTRYIDGSDLAQSLTDGRLSRVEAIQLVIAIARALHYAHGQGVVHRDVKPENILIDRSGKPHLVDLGLALTEENVGRGPRTLGTPAYMSPEQARGEGHRVDGRTDIYSLGVILYEVLLGRRPFSGSSSRELMEHIVLGEPKPPRQVDDSIPRELERICLKCRPNAPPSGTQRRRTWPMNCRRFWTSKRRNIKPHHGSDRRHPPARRMAIGSRGPIQARTRPRPFLWPR
jgi:serine/threonine protein kinase